MTMRFVVTLRVLQLRGGNYINSLIFIVATEWLPELIISYMQNNDHTSKSPSLNTVEAEATPT